MRQFAQFVLVLGLAAFLVTGAGLLSAQQPQTTPEPQPAVQPTPTAETRLTTEATAEATLEPLPLLTPEATAETVSRPLHDQTYTVVRGDRLLKIADRFGVSLDCLARANRIVNPNLIFIGQRLLIPVNCTGQGGGETTPTTSTATVTSAGITGSGQCQFDRYPGRVAPGGVYTIRAGDTLDFIACDFGIALSCLLETNPQIGANRGRIRAGDEITINLACPGWEGDTIP
ncbi:MAG: LysM peptidoglycan-binding domain-containing protein [Chloroflexi bacterium]|nr:LysM peptidoglycan-binding domain-containing protein [Chloroflexota bacterium]